MTNYLEITAAELQIGDIIEDAGLLIDDIAIDDNGLVQLTIRNTTSADYLKLLVLNTTDFVKVKRNY